MVGSDVGAVEVSLTVTQCLAQSANSPETNQENNVVNSSITQESAMGRVVHTIVLARVNQC